MPEYKFVKLFISFPVVYRLVRLFMDDIIVLLCMPQYGLGGGKEGVGDSRPGSLE